MKQIACLGIGLTLSFSLLGLPLAAQSPAAQNQAQPSSSTSASGPSLGDYARQIKKTPTSKSKVFDNDNLPTEDKLSVVGTPAPADNEAKAETSEAPAGEAKTGSDAKAASAPTSLSPEAEEVAKQALWKQWGEKLASQKDQVDLLTRELTVLQKEYELRAAAMYGDVGNRLRNEGDWDKQDAQYKQQIADKQKTLDDAKQKLQDMQEEARKAGVPSSFIGE